jgi:hypothetical protein
MSERLEKFWDALAALTFAELVEVASIMRDACDSTSDFEQSDVQEWSFLLNSAREIAEAQCEDAQ